VGLENRMNRELLTVYRTFPALKSILGNLDEMRRYFDQMILAMQSRYSVSNQVRIRDDKAEGLPGGPDVPIRIYEPVSSARPVPALLWVHGGGFTLGSPRQDDLQCSRLVEFIGCVVVSVDYRLAPEYPFPAGVEDCYGALLWLSKSAHRLGVDNSRIGVGGESAGGGIAAGVAIMARDRRDVNLNYQLLLCPSLDDRHITQSSYEATDKRNWYRDQSLECWRAYLSQSTESDVSPYAAPARLEDCAGLPPAYLMVGELDLMRDEVIGYASRLIQAAVATELHVWPGAFHGFEVLVPNAQISTHAVRDYMNALKRHFNTTGLEEA
jgi:acetyl esterase/lipase